MSLLLLLISIDPNLTSVLLRSNLLILLHDLIQELLSLDFILFLYRLLLNVKDVCFTFSFVQLLDLILILPLVFIHEELLLRVRVLHQPVLLTNLFELSLCIEPAVVSSLQMCGNEFVI